MLSWAPFETLGKLTYAEKVYRGISGGVLPDEFWEANEVGVCGGIEYAFMSTTLAREVAFSYAKSAAQAPIPGPTAAAIRPAGNKPKSD